MLVDSGGMHVHFVRREKDILLKVIPFVIKFQLQLSFELFFKFCLLEVHISSDCPVIVVRSFHVAQLRTVKSKAVLLPPCRRQRGDEI
jgi:hypothetical protein